MRFLDVPIDELRARIAVRNKDLPAATFQVDEADLVLWSQSFEPPSADELVEDS